MRALLPPDPDLATDGFRLRPFTRDDVEAIVAAGSDIAILEHTFMPERPTATHAREWVEQAISGWSSGLARFALADAPSGRCLGQIGLKVLEYPAGNAEAFYWLLPEARGRGWAAPALRLVTEWGVDVLALERISVLIDPDNVASLAVARRAGFTPEGILRGYEAVPRRGRVDLWSCSILASDLER